MPGFGVSSRDTLDPAPTGRSLSVGSVPVVPNPCDSMAGKRLGFTRWNDLCHIPFECGRHVLELDATGMDRCPLEEARVREEGPSRWSTHAWRLLFYQGEVGVYIPKGQACERHTSTIDMYLVYRTCYATPSSHSGI